MADDMADFPVILHADFAKQTNDAKAAAAKQAYERGPHAKTPHQRHLDAIKMAEAYASDWSPEERDAVLRENERLTGLPTAPRIMASAPRPYADMKPHERAELKRRDPEAFNRQRNEHAREVRAARSAVAAAKTYADYEAAHERFKALTRNGYAE